MWNILEIYSLSYPIPLTAVVKCFEWLVACLQDIMKFGTQILFYLYEQKILHKFYLEKKLDMLWDICGHLLSLDISCLGSIFFVILACFETLHNNGAVTKTEPTLATL